MIINIHIFLIKLIMKNLHIYGASGHGKVVLYTFAANKIHVAGFIDDEVTGVFCDLPVVSSANLMLKADSQGNFNHHFHIAIGWLLLFLHAE